MKKFITVFCAISILSTVSVSANPETYTDNVKQNCNIQNNKPDNNIDGCDNDFVPGDKEENDGNNQGDNNGNDNDNNQGNNNGNDNDSNQGNNNGNDNNQDSNTSVQKSMEQQVVNLVNEERTKNGLSPLTINSQVSKVAQVKSEDMKDNNYFSHTSPNYGSPFDMLKQFNVSYTSAGENIAKGQKTPEAVVNAWMNSEGHRKNILNPSYTQIGIGYATRGSTPYWTQMFIR